MTSARDREHDEWIPWYVEDTPGWVELSLAARGAMEGIARKLNRRTGQLALRRGLSSLALLLHARWEELEPALAELIAKGKVTWDQSRFVLADPEYVERKRRTGADRMAELRARKRGAPNVTGVTPVTSHLSPASPVTDVTPVLVFSDLISSGSDLGSQTRAPEWWQGVLDTVEMATGVALPSAESWLRYDGHRDGKGIAPKPKDAQYWLTSVMVAERRKARDEALHREKRDKAYDDKRRFKEPEKPPQPTKAQSKAFSDELASRVRAARLAGGGQ